jgi:hypothetical protein
MGYYPASFAIPLFAFILDNLTPYPTDEHLWPSLRYLFGIPDEILNWFWQHASAYTLDMPTLNEFCLRMTLRHLAQCAPHERPVAQQLLHKYLTPGLVHRIRTNQLVFLDDLFASYSMSDDKHHEKLELIAPDIGAIWLATLADHGIDIASYLAHEFDSHPGHLLRDYGPDGFFTDDVSWQVVWTYSDEDGHGVKLCDEDRSPGTLVAYEFITLVLASETGEWPFAERKGVRKMPGAWDES